MRRAFLELLRPANVATSLADVLAGNAVAGLGGWTTLAWLLVSTAALYAGGVVLNDVFDRDIDRVERPERPIPSGRVTTAAAAALGAILLAAGLFAAQRASHESFVVALLLAAAILLYDAWGKRQKLFGPVNMGACRGLNLILGMTTVAGSAGAHWQLGLIPPFYICAVPIVSRGQVTGRPRPPANLALGPWWDTELFANWFLNLASELVFVGDEGTTGRAGRATGKGSSSRCARSCSTGSRSRGT